MVRNLLNKAKNYDSKRQVKISREEEESNIQKLLPQIKRSGFFEEQEADNETEFKVDKILKVKKTSKKKKPVLIVNIFNNIDEVNQYVNLEGCTDKPACEMCKYQCYDNIFENKRVCVWNRDIKQTNHGCAYCDVALCNLF